MQRFVAVGTIRLTILKDLTESQSPMLEVSCMGLLVAPGRLEDAFLSPQQPIAGSEDEPPDW